MNLTLTRHSRITAGILLLALVTVETGGLYLIRVVGYGEQVTEFQLGFQRAGHAHAGVLLILSLVALLFADAARVQGIAGWLGRGCIPAAALLMSAGFFLSSLGDGRTEPSALIVLVYLGGVSLAVGLITLGVSLLRSAHGSDAKGATEPVAEPA